MRRAALVFVAFFSAIVFPTVFNFSLPGQLSIAQALPSLSGATTTDVPNDDFSGVGLGEVGTPPANNDFETPGGQVGTPPTNNGFDTGDFTGWTLTGSPTVQSGGLDWEPLWLLSRQSFPHGGSHRDVISRRW